MPSGSIDRAPFASEAQLRAAVAVERERRARAKARLPLAEFVPAVSPNLIAPYHLAPIVEAFERIDAGEEVRLVISAPPQHSKSVTALHALVWYHRRNRRKRSGYATYAQHFAGDQSEIAEAAARRAALRIEAANRSRWDLGDGGRISWTSRGGPLTGRPIDGVLLIDDLIKDWEEAQSPVIRQKALDWLATVAETRVHPGASIVMIATRWHENDPSGVMIREHGWESINLPAIKPNGEPLWPEQRPLPYLERLRETLGPHKWSALYMGDPRPVEGRVFGPAVTFQPGEGPEGPYESAWGFDAAYTKATRADYSVAIELRRYVESGRYAIGDVLRVQEETETVIDALVSRGIHRIHWGRSGTEKALEAWIEAKGISVKATPVSADKYVRAQPVSVAWNRGEIEIPARAAWARPLIEEIESFTGTPVDRHDDQVDALASAYDALGPTRREPRIRVLG